MEKKSAIDTIYDIFEELKTINKRLDLLDGNIKLLNNKLLKLKVQDAAEPISAESDKTRLYGSFMKEDKVTPLQFVTVRIYNNSDDLIMTRTSNESGFWEARVKSGFQYKITFDATKINPKFPIIERNIKVESGTKNLEVK